ncbi:UPF0158 family protein [Algibacillus agarilyticus]|uniref:UPF0158 family protein n=1 Tax=Algibacillus agarilyticus TaxID=2234133 RepID=UPI000DCF6E2D|nr:UPF0158 family protein [Algibacillus agarilyticus]
MKIKFNDILDLFELVNFGSPFEQEGYICKESGKTYFYSEFGDNEEELPDDINDDKYLAIPYKNELDLGNNLVFDFTLEHLPTEYEKVRSIFKSKGAYTRFKSLLESKNKLEEWFKFETMRNEEALREWCTEQGLILY